jgi:hypothetical protein
MAIVDARVLRRLTLSETKEKQTVKLSAEQSFIVISDTRNPLFSDILANTSTFTNLGGGALPQVSDEVTVNGTTLVVTARKLSWYDDSDRVVQMDVSYSGVEEQEGGSEPPNNTDEGTWRRISARTQAITMPARGWTTQAEAAAANTEEKPPRNAAGDPVEGIEENVNCVALTYTNPGVVSPNFENLNAYANTCNNTQFLGAVPYTVCCQGWSGEFDEKTQKWSISIEFLFNPKGWYVEYINAGFNEINGGDRKAIVDKLGNPVSTPVPLDANGAALPAGFADGDLVTLDLYPYEAKELGNIFVDCNV